MTKTIFLNLPVTDLARSTEFYEAIGFTKNPMFSNERASAMTWSDTISIMLLTHDFYATFTRRPIAVDRSTSQMLIALSCNDRAGVDAMTVAAIDAGGREVHDAEDVGFMYSRAFEDPDGHEYGPFWMDPNAASAPAESV